MSAATSIISADDSKPTAVESHCVNIEPFATLINKKILLPSQKTNYVAVETHFLVTALRVRVEEIFVDEDWYLDKHPDVRTAITTRVVNNAREHYVLHGFYEHRLPYEISVDEAWYLAQYEDVKKAVESGFFETGQLHFDRLGYREGRLPFAGFRLRALRRS